MFQNTRLSRRNFLKLNAVLSSAAAVSVVLPAVAAAKSIPVTAPVATDHTDSLEHIELMHPTTVRYGTPTDVAATWPGEAWSVDAAGVIRKYDHQQRLWVQDADEADLDGDFPVGSQLVLARWGRPAGPNQMLMVLADASAAHRAN